MIDTPFSIMSNRNTSATNGRDLRLTTALILPSASHIWLQQTMNGQKLLPDNFDLSEVTGVYGAVRTNAAYIGNVSEAD